MNIIKIILIGDVVGSSGCAMFQKHMPDLIEKYAPSAIIVNGENSAADGRGITIKGMKFFKHNKANIVTSGNHIWAKHEIYQYLNENRDLLRPANFPSECPGTGATILNCDHFSIGIMNLQGRIFMREQLSCPFKTAETILTYLSSKTNIILVDFHAEATAEKLALGYYLDGKVSAVVGTHTHVQTADNRVLPNGTAYITDLGMSGALNSMIGMKKDPIINSIITQMPVRFVVETQGPMILSGVIVSIDTNSGKAQSIERIYIVDNNLENSVN